MNRLRIAHLLTLLCLGSLSIPAAEALPQNFEFRDGQGEEIKIESGWFGRKKKVVKDRMGNKFESKNGLFGSSSTEASVMGNSIKRKKGLFGTSNIEGSTIFGDKVTTKKGLFGRRTTSVDVSGSAAVLKGLFGAKPPTKSLDAILPGGAADGAGIGTPIGDEAFAPSP